MMTFNSPASFFAVFCAAVIFVGVPSSATVYVNRLGKPLQDKSLEDRLDALLLSSRFSNKPLNKPPKTLKEAMSYLYFDDIPPLSQAAPFNKKTRKEAHYPPPHHSEKPTPEAAAAAAPEHESVKDNNSDNSYDSTTNHARVVVYNVAMALNDSWVVQMLQRHEEVGIKLAAAEAAKEEVEKELAVATEVRDEMDVWLKDVLHDMNFINTNYKPFTLINGKVVPSAEHASELAAEGVDALNDLTDAKREVERVENKLAEAEAGVKGVEGELEGIDAEVSAKGDHVRATFWILARSIPAATPPAVEEEEALDSPQDVAAAPAPSPAAHEEAEEEEEEEEEDTFAGDNEMIFNHSEYIARSSSGAGGDSFCAEVHNDTDHSDDSFCESNATDAVDADARSSYDEEGLSNVKFGAAASFAKA